MIRRLIRTLELLAAHPLTAAELARELDINRSTSLRLLAELVETGYVTRDAGTKQFAIVPSRFQALAPHQERHTDNAQVIDPVLAEIRDETGESTILGVPSGPAMVYLAFFPTVHGVAVVEQLGTVRPMHCSALGKAYLSAVDPSTLHTTLRRIPYEGGTGRAARSGAELRDRVRSARNDGYALDLDETFEGGRCVAVPMRVGGCLVGSVGISGPSARLATPRMRELGGYLLKKLAKL